MSNLRNKLNKLALFLIKERGTEKFKRTWF